MIEKKIVIPLLSYRLIHRGSKTLRCTTRPIPKTMKIKHVVAVLVLALLASLVIVTAQEDLEVLSLNTIGYIKRELPADGKLITVSLPLHSMSDTEHVFGNLSLAAEAPSLSLVSFWDPVAQEWSGGTKAGKGGWPDNVVTQKIAPGEFFFLRGPLEGGTEEITITGEVPSEPTLVRAVAGGDAFSSVANPYPTDVVFGDTELAATAPELSVVSFWDASAQVWFGGSKAAKGGWPAGVVTQRVGTTEGFFIKQPGTGVDWTAAKPYTWP